MLLYNGPVIFMYLYNDAQTTFNETKTFSKIRIYFLDANQPSTNQTLASGTLGSFPNENLNGGANQWGGANLNPVGGGGDTAVTEGFDSAQTWTLSGAAPDGGIRSDISPNGWQLGWELKFTEHKDISAGAIPLYMSKNGGDWVTSVSDLSSIKVAFNPQAYALVTGTQFGVAPGVPQTFNSGDITWWDASWNDFGYIYNSQSAGWFTENTYYVEIKLGNQAHDEAATGNPFSYQPVTFTNGRIYVAQLKLTNLIYPSLFPGAPGGAVDIYAINKIQLIE